MSASFLGKTQGSKVKWSRLFALPLWVIVGFGVSHLTLTGILLTLKAFGVSFATVNLALLNTVLAASLYTLSLLVVIGVPWLLRKHTTNREELGLQRLPSWMDIVLAPVGFGLYLFLSAIVLYIVGLIFPAFDGNQLQETGFGNLSQRYEYALAFITLVVIAPIAEEILFRGYLYGKLRKTAPAWLAIVITSLLFGAVHGQWNVAIDVFVLGVMLSVLREVTGSIWAGILLHMIKNGVAFYLLFINPSLLRIMGG